MTAAVLATTLGQDKPLKLGLALIAPWGLGWHLAWQLGRLSTEDPDNCLRIFRSNRDAGLIAALFLAAAAFL